MSKGFLFHRFAITSAVLFFSYPSIAQEKISVSGIVFDAATRLPIRNANVFFNHTSLASITDSMGVYKIDNVPMGLRELVASSVGYVTQTQNLNTPDKRPVIFFKMHQDNPPGIVGNGTGTGKRRIPVVTEKKWNELYIRFKKAFLGEDDPINHTEILNSSIIHFELSDTDLGLFFAKTDRPLEIINRALGYRLSVSLVEFEASPTTHVILFRTQFDSLKASNAIEKMHWRINRLSIYQGSPRHFFKSAQEGRLLEEGFMVYKGQLRLGPRGTQYYYEFGNKPAAASAIYLDSTRTHFKAFGAGLYQINYVDSYIQKKDRYFIDYPFPVSWLNVKDPSVNLDSHGEPILPANFSFSGYMNSYRVSEMLPSDYDPIQEKSNLELSGQLNSFVLRGTVQDEKNVPLADVEVFINGGLHHTKTNDMGQFEMHNLHPGLYPVAFVHPEMEQILLRLPVSESDTSAVLIQLREKKIMAMPTDEFNHDRGNTWQELMHFFESKLCRAGNYNSIITNPYVLILKPSEKRIDIQTLGPLIIDDKSLGYRYTYFMDSASLVKSNGSYKLSASGLVKMDTLSSRSLKESYRWQSNRFNEYIGSWNHYAHALMEGKTEAEGFKTYQLIKQSTDKVLEWNKLSKNDCVAIIPDSILRADKTKFHLQIPKGFEIHYKAKRDGKKMYSDYAYRVIRIDAGSSPVPITVDGIVAPGSCDRMETQRELLPRLAVDFYPESMMSTNRLAKPYIK